MKVAVPKEVQPTEKRVAATPETVKRFLQAGFSVSVQSGAGEACFISDTEYEKAGASVVTNAKSLYKEADLVLKVQRPTGGGLLKNHELDLVKEGAVLIAFLQPLVDPAYASKLAERKLTAFAMEMIPRIARAQKMDALSSQSNVAGYKAVLMAANALGKLMPMMITAAGTISPARVLVIGAGVAGLQAIATARRLGAVVEVFDTRPVVKEQVESLGGKFVSLDLSDQETEDKSGYAKELSKEAHEREMELISQHVKAADIVITTAQIPGKKAPVLIPEETVRGMRPGSVIVDLAIEGGGNCTLSQADHQTVQHGVTILAPRNVPSLMPSQSSQLYARNVMNFVLEITKNGNLALDLENPVVRDSLITHQGEVVHPAVQKLLNMERTTS